MVTSTAYSPVGPAYLALGDATTADGVDMEQLGLIRDVAFNPNVRMAFTSADAQSGAPHADGLYTLANQPEVTARMQSLTYEEAIALILNATDTSSGTSHVLGGPDKFESVTDASVPTLAVIPSTESADKEDAEHGIWLPAVTVSIQNLNFGRVEEGEIDQAFDITFQGAYRSADQGSTTIPEGNRLWFIGRPSILGLGWSLPTLS